MSSMVTWPVGKGGTHLRNEALDVLRIDVLRAKEDLLGDNLVEGRQVALAPDFLVVPTDEVLVRFSRHDKPPYLMSMT
jgi:hypothetical protein